MCKTNHVGLPHVLDLPVQPVIVHITLGTWDTSPTHRGTWGMQHNHFLPLRPSKVKGWVVGMMAYVILVPVSVIIGPLYLGLGLVGLDLGLGLDNLDRKENLASHDEF